MNEPTTAEVDHRILVVEDDIAGLHVDAVVSVSGGVPTGRVDRAIHRLAGPGLLEEYRRLGGCGAGDARVTGGHLLPARFVIHTVVPTWHGGGRDVGAVLASCYRRCLEEGLRAGAGAVAFPAVVTGAPGCPAPESAAIAVREVRAWLASNVLPVGVVFCAAEADDTAVIEAALGWSS